MNKKKTTHPKNVLDDCSNQLNPQHPEFYRCRGINLPLAERLAKCSETPGALPDESRCQSQKNPQPK